jgi:hypothetical protein
LLLTYGYVLETKIQHSPSNFADNRAQFLSRRSVIAGFYSAINTIKTTAEAKKKQATGGLLIG